MTKDSVATLETTPAAALSTRRLAAAVGLVAAAMLLVEITVTRLYSVLFYYHYSFFAVSLVMSGLTLGGLVAALPILARHGAQDRLAIFALAFALGIVPGLAMLVTYAPVARSETASTGTVAAMALVFLPGLVAAGAFLAQAFSIGSGAIGRLYAADMVCASAACLLAIAALRTMQGPAALLAPIGIAAGAAALLARARPVVWISWVMAVASVACAFVHVASGGSFLRLALLDPPSYERWNEYSRVLVYDAAKPGKAATIIIDKTASTRIPYVPARPPGGPIQPAKSWDDAVTGAAYRIGRPLGRVAVIGVGGGRDLLPGLAQGAHVDGFEINGIILHVLRHRASAQFPVAGWPEVSLHHGEARVGIAHAGQRYDVIQASLIDTWAATAGGGFVLSENGIYTVEGWRTFLHALSPSGVLTMTRWHVPEAPAETERLVSLAAAALDREGFPDARGRVVLIGEGPPDSRAQHARATILVSRAPFSDAEMGRLRAPCRGGAMHLMAGPGIGARDPALDALLAPPTRAAAIAASPFDITPPTDERPYFFLQLRPRALLHAPPDAGFVLDITFRAVRVMWMLAGFSWIFTAAVVLLARWLAPSATDPLGVRRRGESALTLYFACIGFGYIMVQLAMHQRLILVLGHPTTALSVVLSSMLLGTGCGSLLSSRLFSARTIARAFAAILVPLAALLALWPQASGLEGIASGLGRGVAVAGILGLVGFVLGFGFPLGVGLATAAMGASAVPRMWAINGAASIAGSATAAVLGVAYGSRVVMALGLLAYGVAAVSGTRTRATRPACQPLAIMRP